MKRWYSAFAILAVCSLALVSNGRAQQGTNGKEKSIYSRLHFRDLGPAQAGGRVAAVAGIPGNPNVYYVGAAGGGVWKTTDGGESWKAIFQHEGCSSIGAIALAPSDPSQVWVGTGEANPRNDLITGCGLYYSPDGGNTWKFMGLKDAGQISSVLVDPRDPNTVFVGVLGHAWGPNAERGVFKTTDGGKTWNKVLFVNDSTGVSDLVMAPNNPKVLFAGMWQFRRYPWMLDDGGMSGGVFRSIDGGETWQKLTEGLPKGPLGRIALAIAPTNPDHVYALIESKHGLLWQSLNMGKTWKFVSNNYQLDVRPFYFNRLFVDPKDQEKLYFLSFQLMESKDGGKTAFVLDPRVHVDHHAFWIDPDNPDRIIQGNDGGAYLTLNGGKTWKFLDGMPIEEAYMVGVGTDSPHTLCEGLQDNNAWCGVGNFWYTVAGGDGQYAMPAPSDPNIIYADSQNGSLGRIDKTAHTRWFVRPTMVGVSQEAPADLKYRFNWTAPFAVSPTDANEVYIGGDVVFRTLNGGRTWTPISSDLTRNDKSKQKTSGGPIEYDISGAETYDTITSITLAPSNPNVIWVGSDDGMVHVTENGGKTWTDVTANITGAPEWARVYQIGVSPFDPGTAYVSFDGHELDNNHPYVFRTHDYGKTWQEIINGLPDEPVDVVREDPNDRGLLVLGDMTGLYFSTNDGDQWQKFPVSFPTVPVWDLQFIKSDHDLAVATHGRGILVLDDMRPVEETTTQVTSSALHLYDINNAILRNFWRPLGGENNALYQAPPAPMGAIVDYYLSSSLKPTPAERMAHRGPVTITIADEKGNTIATHYAVGKAGINRYIWNLRYQGPVPLSGEHQRRGGMYAFFRAAAPEVAPGTYKVTVSANGQSQTKTVTVEGDPNFHVNVANFQANVAYGLEARDMLSTVDTMINNIRSMQGQLKAFAADVSPNGSQPGDPRYSDLLSEGHKVQGALAKLMANLYNTKVQHQAPEDDLHWLADFHSQLSGLVFGGSPGYDLPPTPQALARIAQLHSQLAQRVDAYNQFVKSDMASYNKMAEKVKAPALFAGAPVTVPAAGK